MSFWVNLDKVYKSFEAIQCFTSKNKGFSSAGKLANFSD
jgi:hypothetical protein